MVYDKTIALAPIGDGGFGAEVELDNERIRYVDYYPEGPNGKPYAVVGYPGNGIGVFEDDFEAHDEADVLEWLGDRFEAVFYVEAEAPTGDCS